MLLAGRRRHKSLAATGTKPHRPTARGKHDTVIIVVPGHHDAEQNRGIHREETKASGDDGNVAQHATNVNNQEGQQHQDEGSTTADAAAASWTERIDAASSRGSRCTHGLHGVRVARGVAGGDRGHVPAGRPVQGDVAARVVLRLDHGRVDGPGRGAVLFLSGAEQVLDGRVERYVHVHITLRPAQPHCPHPCPTCPPHQLWPAA